MHLERIHFDEIFDVVKRSGVFSFKSGGRVRYGASFGNGLIPAEGATYAVVFGRSDDWSTVLGWRDLRSDTVTLRYPLRSWSVAAELSEVLLSSPVLFAAGLFFGGGLGAAFAASLLPLGIGAYQLYRFVHVNRRVRDVLRSLDWQDAMGTPC